MLPSQLPGAPAIRLPWKSCAAPCGRQSEMEALIERTAMSPFIREKKDFYAALFDGEGRLIVGSNLPIFGDAIGPIREHYRRATMREGDIYWYNDCYAHPVLTCSKA